jgi:hypothetical protein
MYEKVFSLYKDSHLPGNMYIHSSASALPALSPLYCTPTKSNLHFPKAAKFLVSSCKVLVRKDQVASLRIYILWLWELSAVVIPSYKVEIKIGNVETNSLCTLDKEENCPSRIWPLARIWISWITWYTLILVSKAYWCFVCMLNCVWGFGEYNHQQALFSSMVANTWTAVCIY